MFVGRQKELSELHTRYQSDQFEFAVFYGRRRVGKTTLINEFCKDKNAIYFVGIESTEQDNLTLMSKAVFDHTMPGMDLPPFESFHKLLDYIVQLTQKERLILVIDEYPYLAESYPAISSILQAYIDRHFLNSKLFLILCGSSMSFMEHQVLGAKSPLYGRRTAQFKIQPFGFKESALMLDGYSNEDKALIYGMTGGIPEYLSRVDTAKTVRENIIAMFLNPSGRLFEEPSNLLKQELRDPSVYNSIIAAIAGGACKQSEIVNKVGLESGAVSNYLSSLINLGLVKKEIPITETVSRKTLYLLEDQMYRFWYRFVMPNLPALQAGRAEEIYEKRIEPELTAYMGFIFEKIAQEYLWELAARGDAPFFFFKLGRWWGNNPVKKQQEEIDIMAIGQNEVLLGECKWNNSPVGSAVVSDLMQQSKLFSYPQTWFYVFAKRSFTPEAIQLALATPQTALVTFAQICAYYHM